MKKAIIIGISIIMLCGCSSSKDQETVKPQISTIQETAKTIENNVIIEDNEKLVLKKAL